jgi:hypothetical protein
VENERISKLSCQRELFLLLGRMSVSQQLDDIGRTTGGDDWAQVKLLLTPRRLVLGNQDTYFRRLIAEVKKPLRHRTPVPLPQDLWSQGSLAYTDVIMNSWRWEKYRTDLALLEVALAVQADYSNGGHYPRGLSDVSRRWLPTIPVDTWDRPISYRLKNGEPIIYSLGPDAKDDDGLAADPITVTPTTKGDLVFGHLSRRLRKP